jgi:hypothetical protein
LKETPFARLPLELAAFVIQVGDQLPTKVIIVAWRALPRHLNYG